MIYFVEVVMGRGGRAVKIGCSSSFEAVEDRVRALQGGNPNPLRLVAVRGGSREDDAALHAKYAHLRIRGEWFRCTRGLDAEIERAAKFDWHGYEDAA